MIAAEQKARVTYDNILRISDDPDVNDAIRFLREREIVHFQRFGEAIELLRRRLDEKNESRAQSAGVSAAQRLDFKKLHRSAWAVEFFSGMRLPGRVILSFAERWRGWR